MKNKGKKVYVGLSGGVDSSVSAALLKDAGYDVTGVFIRVWHPDFLQCDWKAEMRDAMRVCAKLDIPFLKLDLEEEYKKHVIDYMIEEYRKGRTPNPDVMCNKYIKFGGFFDWAMKHGADYVATGHYAQVAKDDTHYKLLTAVDTQKDQTYFLWTLTQKQLAQTLFPIGHLQKDAVRKLAEKYNLFTSEKKDSQGLCFIGHVDMKEFLKRYIDTKRGDVLNEKGNIIGYHDGAVLYTFGERHGFTITEKSSEDVPLYVVDKDITANTITVSPQQPTTGERKKYDLESVQYTHDYIGDQKVQVQIRYRGEKLDAQVSNTAIEFIDSQVAVAPGQSAVFYVENECIGGGIIG